MSRELFITEKPSLYETVYTLIVSVEANLPGFEKYMSDKNLKVKKQPMGSSVNYFPLGIELRVLYLAGGTYDTEKIFGEGIINSGSLVMLSSRADQEIVEDEADKLIPSIGEVYNPSLVQLMGELSELIIDLE